MNFLVEDLKVYIYRKRIRVLHGFAFVWRALIWYYFMNVIGVSVATGILCTLTKKKFKVKLAHHQIKILKKNKNKKNKKTMGWVGCGIGVYYTM